MSTYQPNWLRLSEAKTRIVSVLSLEEAGAEAWLIRAIQDQLRADPEGYAAQTMFRVQGFPTQWKRRRFPRDWPARLTPDRIDWQASTIHGLHPVTLMATDLFIEVSATAIGAGERPSADTDPDEQAAARPASEARIRTEVAAVYAEAAGQKAKPPNIKELGKVVQQRLATAGLGAAQIQIQKIGEEDAFKKLRRPPGATVFSQRGK
ncbi:hypothetical protein XI09_26300 [Bradyrhizobium sp. CCBAU 11386]|uniref:hypothetical protein n=1 Tax=Bradyrhizobium sp. CCBAU 11386 TaxID=1630837 RepID=UPI00230209D2|nr:hypothetical protein [Bradyrhizobium sp. CCBAU 11386]MDA9508086.1 hypothetical protein [Bradyrhizobium sp. CCBAU 11386]